MSDKEVPNTKDICKMLKEIADILDYPRRTLILNAIPPGSEMTFKQLEQVTGIPTSSLHAHLKEMWHAGLIEKTDERPTRYKRSEFLTYLISLILQGNRSVGNNLPDHWGQHRVTKLEMESA